MTDPESTQRMEQALDWAIRVQDGEFDDWESHARWLNVHPGNPDAYARAVFALEDGVARIEGATEPVTVFANDNAPLPQRLRRFGGLTIGGLAVAASALLMFTSMPIRSPDRDVIVVAAGQKRTVALPDGSVVALNGDTELRLDGTRHAILSRGEAYLTVRHDQRHPFELIAGGRTFRDVGTAFNVSLVDGVLTFEVAEGAVVYEPDGPAIRLKAGEGLSILGGRVTRHDVAAASVGSWRAGRLVYRQAPIAKVAADLGRATGLTVDVADGIRGRTFTGVIVVSSDRRATREAVSDILNVTVTANSRGWYLQAAS